MAIVVKLIGAAQLKTLKIYWTIKSKINIIRGKGERIKWMLWNLKNI